jgi:hypothetical protein
VQRAGRCGRLGHGRRHRFRRLDDAARLRHHQLDLGHFVGHGLACTLGGGSAFGGFLGGFVRLALGFVGAACLAAALGSRIGGGGWRRHCAWRLPQRRAWPALRRPWPARRARLFELGQAFLLFTQVRFLASDELG